MQIQILRKFYTAKSTIGIVSIDGIKCGFSLEDVVRPYRIKVPGETAIPAGTYAVVLDYSPKFKRIMPHVLAVPYFEGIRIHKGNGPEDTEGCILVGLKMGPDTVYDCQATYDYIYGSVGEATKRKEKVLLTIEDTPNV